MEPVSETRYIDPLAEAQSNTKGASSSASFDYRFVFGVLGVCLVFLVVILMMLITWLGCGNRVAKADILHRLRPVPAPLTVEGATASLCMIVVMLLVGHGRSLPP